MLIYVDLSVFGFMDRARILFITIKTPIKLYTKMDGPYDSPRQVQATIVTKGEFQSLLERTLCNESISKFIQNGQVCHKTPIFCENDLF